MRGDYVIRAGNAGALTQRLIGAGLLVEHESGDLSWYETADQAQLTEVVDEYDAGAVIGAWCGLRWLSDDDLPTMDGLTPWAEGEPKIAGALPARPEEAGPVPSAISDRQFFQALAMRGDITEAEALAAVRTGDVPAAMQALIDTGVPESQRFAATMMIAGATIFERRHPMTALLGQLYGWSDDEIDVVFRLAGGL